MVERWTGAKAFLCSLSLSTTSSSYTVHLSFFLRGLFIKKLKAEYFIFNKRGLHFHATNNNIGGVLFCFEYLKYDDECVTVL